MSKHILVTGANSGIGLALCKLLATHSTQPCYVYLGSRDLERGTAALKSITDAEPSTVGKIEVLQIDVASDDSVKQAAASLTASLKAKNASLYALVNNAGVGLAHGDVGGPEGVLNVNYYGPKRVTDAIVGLIDKDCGRIVNTSSGMASVWVRGQDAATKTLYSNPELTWEELDAAQNSHLASGNHGGHGGYGLSKAGLSALTIVQKNLYPKLKVVSLSPGFIATKMTQGFGAKLSPEQGCVSSLKCLFDDVTSGWYYGSDGKRSPLTCTRDPGTPEYEGEDNPDPKKYNK